MATTTTTGVLPLTTTFTPAPSCLSDLHLLDFTASGFGQCSAGTSTFNCRYLHLGPRPTTACEPPGWKPQTGVFFSPGVCPSGYSEACSNVITAGTVTETRATCCPSQYTCNAPTETGWPWYGLNGCTYVISTTSTYTYITSKPTGLATSTSVDQFGVNAYAIRIRYQSSDLITATSTSEPTQSPSSTSNTSPSSSLSSGAKAGIGVGVALGAILLIACSLFFFKRRKTTNVQYQRQPEKVELLEMPGVQPTRTYEMSNDTQRFELGEASGTQAPGALGHRQQEPVELATGHQ
ncbi:hypothetical protein PISL3812_00965 [Talaromyces islandicus]|uniref:Uncharacterized protein n=1 Tax=Talaromyces islandicus TaxID=28573 RepID=A0A0U1LNA2_TALIS|nr:hypothetical protein PISL3812_00965 [Talaromyces islandicus]